MKYAPPLTALIICLTVVFVVATYAPANQDGSPDRSEIGRYQLSTTTVYDANTRDVERHLYVMDTTTGQIKTKAIGGRVWIDIRPQFENKHRPEAAIQGEAVR